MAAVEMKINVNQQQLLLAFQRAPDTLKKNMSQAISRIVAGITRTARINAPKAFSTLTQSIIGRRLSPLHGEVVAGVNYAEYVEDGRKPGKMPPPENIFDWLVVKNIHPEDPHMDTGDLAWAIAQSIAREGTKPQPYLKPALDSHHADAVKRVDAAIEKTLQGMR